MNAPMRFRAPHHDATCSSSDVSIATPDDSCFFRAGTSRFLRGSPVTPGARMSSLNRKIEGAVLVRHLKRDEQMIDQDLLARHGRSARTLVKDGPLRLTLIALAANGGMPSHRADGPVSIHLLEGDVVLSAEGSEYTLVPGEVLVLAAGVAHGVKSNGGCMLLLTIVHLP